jgi:hypothetical protein
MIDLLENFEELELLLPETVCLEPEHFARAREISVRGTNEAHQWQIYLNSLAQLSLVQWLGERMPDKAISLENSSPIGVFGNIRVSDFRLYAIATEQILDEVVNLPGEAIFSPELAAHFYVLLEVSEEQKQVTIRGCLRYDCLIDYLTQVHLQPLQNNYYQIPLSEFEAESNHLLFYCRYLEPDAISLPVTSATHLPEALQNKTKLSDWLQEVFAQEWQAIEQLIDLQTNLAFSTRNVDLGSSRGKLINLGMQLGNQTVALIMNVMPETEANKLRIIAQLYPTGKQKYLPQNIKISLLSKAEKILQEVQARNQDNYIQLKPFLGELGKCFSIEISLLEMSFRKNFEF